MLDVCMLGSGGSVPLPERGLSSLFVHFGNIAMLIDCGEGTQVSAKKIGINLGSLDYVFLTHLHYDHVLGLPGLLASLDNPDRKNPVVIFGPVGVKRAVENMLYAGRFKNLKMQFHEFRGNEDIDFGNFRVSVFQVEHSVKCYGYAFYLPRGCLFDPDKAAAQGVPVDALSPLQLGHTVVIGGKRYDKNSLFGPDRRGIRFVYATDTRMCDNLVKYGKDADLMFLEGMYPNRDTATQTGGDEHLTFEEAASVARVCNAGKLVLTHFGPSNANPEAFLHCAQLIFQNTVCGYRGYTETITYDNVVNLHSGDSKCTCITLGQQDFDCIAAGTQYFFTCDYGTVKAGDVVQLVSDSDDCIRKSVFARVIGVAEKATQEGDCKQKTVRIKVLTHVPKESTNSDSGKLADPKGGCADV